MEQPPSLQVEAPPNNEQPRLNGARHTNLPASPESQSSPGSPSDRRPGSASPPVRKDTTSSASTLFSNAATNSIRDTEPGSNGIVFERDRSEPREQHREPIYAPQQAVFSVKDALDSTPGRRASRRRTGPLTATQRERAALIRKMGACVDCRRRRVACEPAHHNMNWDEAYRKFGNHSPTMKEIAPLSVSGRKHSSSTLTSPTTAHNGVYHDPMEMEMDVDSTPSHQPGRASLSDTRISRTPLPSGPRPDKTTPMTPMFNMGSPRNELQDIASRILADPYRGRYAAVQVLLLYWHDDDAPDVKETVRQLADILAQRYNYTLEIKVIPSPSESGKSSWKWLSSTITSFVEHRDQRDVLKIVYYNGHSYLDADRQMVLASSRNPDSESVVRWSGIQQILEEGSCSDILLLMDAAYYPSSTLLRKRGVFELVAASTGEDHAKHIGRNKFTRALCELLNRKTSVKTFEHFTAAEIHAKLLSSYYPKMIQDWHPDQEVITSFPSPLHLQISGDSRLPSISLAPLPKGPLSAPDSVQNGVGHGSQLIFTFRLTDDDVNVERWSEWLRQMPDGVKDVMLDGYRNTFR